MKTATTTLAIGDVHGCVDELDMLVSKAIDINHRINNIVFLGDLIDRGPDSLGVIQYAMDLKESFSVKLIRGNHDDRFIRFHKHRTEGNEEALSSMTTRYSWYDWKPISDEIDSDLYDFMASGLYYLRDMDRGVIFVHGGIPPRLNILPMDPTEVFALSNRKRKQYNQMMYLRFVSEDLEFVKCYEEGANDRFWALDYDGRFGHAYFGHTPHQFIEHNMYPHATCLDHGGVFGGSLAGVIIEDGRTDVTVTQKAMRKYA